MGCAIIRWNFLLVILKSGMVYRRVFPSSILPSCLSFYILRGFSPDLGENKTRPCSVKFSAHLVVKHHTHMFQDLEAMLTFLDQLKLHSDWQACASIIDVSVYKKNQQLRVACATKSPHFNPVEKSFETSNVNNILLPVHSKTGELDKRGLRVSKKNIYLCFNLWSKFLVTTSDVGTVSKVFPLGTLQSGVYRILP